MTVTADSRHFLLTEKYRPQHISDCILPKRIISLFESMAQKGEIQNLLLTGPAGTGKTSIAKALCHTLDCEYIIINCSESGNIDTIRTLIRRFASGMSMDGRPKVVILDESDGITPVAQQALRNFIEEFSVGCRFIFTANYLNKIIEPLQSRLVPIDFTYTKDEKLEVVIAWDTRVRAILEQEQIVYDETTLRELIGTYFPDFRKTLNMLQRFTHDGQLNPSAMGFITSDAVAMVYGLLKVKKFSDMRKWVAENSDNDFATLSRALWNRVDAFVEPDSIPQFLLHLNEYQYKHAFAIDKEVNLMAFLTCLMVDVKFK